MQYNIGNELYFRNLQTMLPSLLAFALCVARIAPWRSVQHTRLAQNCLSVHPPTMASGSNHRSDRTSLLGAA